MNEIIKGYQETISEGRKNCDQLIDRAKRSSIKINRLETQSRKVLEEIVSHLEKNDSVSTYAEYVDKTIKDIMNFEPYNMTRYARMSNTIKTFKKDDGFVNLNDTLNKLSVLLHRMYIEAKMLKQIFDIMKYIGDASYGGNDTLDRTLKTLNSVNK